MTVRTVAREPLAHFLAAGGLLFVLSGFVQPDRPDLPAGRTIAVDDESLLTFLQYRSKAFKPQYFSTQLAAMTAAERQRLEEEFVEEEMLYREAKSLGLEEGDYVIRQRLVQKMRYLIDDLVATAEEPDERSLEEYLRRNQDLYRIEPSVTFTHVFIDAALHGDRRAGLEADRLKTTVKSAGAGFDDAPRYGDRFPFLLNYVERTADYVASHFGSEFVAQLDGLAPSTERWHGPVRSDHGYHLVLLTGRTAARVPELHEIRGQVADDWRRERLQRARSESIVQLSRQYTIARQDLPGE